MLFYFFNIYIFKTHPFFIGIKVFKEFGRLAKDTMANFAPKGYHEELLSGIRFQFGGRSIEHSEDHKDKCVAAEIQTSNSC